MLNALSQCLQDTVFSFDRGRIVSIEDVPELRIPHENCLRLVMPQVDWKCDSEMTKRMLVRKALRMNADRIVVGDCEGAEAYELMYAMANSHLGSLTSVTALTPADCLKRLENMILLSDPAMRLPMARHLIARANPLIVQIRQLEDGTRRVTEMAHVENLVDDEFVVQTIFYLQRTGRDPRGFFKCEFGTTMKPPKFLEQLEHNAVPFKLEWLGFPQVGKRRST